MKVYQCIHKYGPHIPAFEERNNIPSRDLSFAELRDLLIADGYASTYVLKPALEGRHDEVFFTLWDYKRLQYKWAEENGLETKDLREIKKAQIEAFSPDVFYNHSPRYDDNFVECLGDDLIKVCWDAVIKEYPWYHNEYDARVTLFEPYVKYWRSKNMQASLLTPAYVPSWKKYEQPQRDKDIDVLFYGQYTNTFFSERNEIIEQLLEWQKGADYNVHVHLQGLPDKKPLVNVRGLRRLTRWVDQVPNAVREYARGPIYGEDLYRTIGKSKVVVNAFTDYNGLFKDNMRTYEGIGMGALLVGQDGIYPNFIDTQEDVLTYKNKEEMTKKIGYALSHPEKQGEMAHRAHSKMKDQCSKEEQWNQFCSVVESVKR